MRVSIKRCDFCGADHSPENPVSMTIGGVKTGRKVPSRGGIFGLLDGGTAVDERADLDMCAACGAGLLDIVRAAVARRHATDPPKPKPAPESDAYDAMRLVLGMPISGRITDYNSIVDDEGEES